MISANILNILLFLPLFGILIISFIPSNYSFFLKLISLVVAGCSFLISMLLWLQFDKSVGSFQMVSIILFAIGTEYYFMKQGERTPSDRTVTFLLAIGQ